MCSYVNNKDARQRQTMRSPGQLFSLKKNNCPRWESDLYNTCPVTKRSLLSCPTLLRIVLRARPSGDTSCCGDRRAPDAHCFLPTQRAQLGVTDACALYAAASGRTLFPSESFSPPVSLVKYPEPPSVFACSGQLYWFIIMKTTRRIPRIRPIMRGYWPRLAV